MILLKPKCICFIILNILLGGMDILGSLEKFTKPIAEPALIINQVNKGEEVAPNIEIFKIKNMFLK